MLFVVKVRLLPTWKGELFDGWTLMVVIDKNFLLDEEVDF